MTLPVFAVAHLASQPLALFARAPFVGFAPLALTPLSIGLLSLLARLAFAARLVVAFLLFVTTLRFALTFPLVALLALMTFSLLASLALVALPHLTLLSLLSRAVAVVVVRRLLGALSRLALVTLLEITRLAALAILGDAVALALRSFAGPPLAVFPLFAFTKLARTLGDCRRWVRVREREGPCLRVGRVVRSGVRRRRRMVARRARRAVR